MEFHLGVLIPAPIADVFDFFDDPANVLALGGHAAEHVEGLEGTTVEPDGRRTFDFRMRAGRRHWMQSVRQVVRDRPHRLVTESWTWDADRQDPYLRATIDRRLTLEDGVTSVDMDVHFELMKRSLAARALGWLQRGQVRSELAHQLHYVAEHFDPTDDRKR